MSLLEKPSLDQSRNPKGAVCHLFFGMTKKLSPFARLCSQRFQAGSYPKRLAIGLTLVLALLYSPATARADDVQAAGLSVDSAWRAWSAAEHHPWFPIAATVIDPDTREVWAGTWGGGLLRYSAGRFDTFHQLNSALAGDLVLSVALCEGKVWAATNGGLSATDPLGKEWDLHFPRQAHRETPMPTFVTCRAGQVIACMGNGQWMHYNNARKEWKSAAPDPGRAALCVNPTDYALDWWNPGTLPTNRSEMRASPAAVAVYGPRNRTIALPGSPEGMPYESGRPDLNAVELAIERFSSNAPTSDRRVELVMVHPGYARYGWG